MFTPETVLILSKLVLIALSGYLFFISFRHSKSGSFFGDTPWWWWLGVYVWGDGLVLGPFWFFSAITWLFMPIQVIVLWIIIFHTIRSAYEVIYWLHHQAVKKEYRPPLFRSVEWLSAESAAIVYQVTHMCVVVIGILLGIMTVLI